MQNPTHLITNSELEAVIACSPPLVCHSLELLHFTGMRPEELRLCQVGDLIDGRIRAPWLKRKTGAGVSRSMCAQRGLLRSDVTRWRWLHLAGVPAAIAAWEALAGSRAASEPLLASPRRPGHPVSRSYLSHRWARAWEAAGLRPGQERPPLYSLRHTRATLLVEAGVKPPALCALMGWASIQMALVYYEASPRILEEALARSVALTV